MTVTAPTNNSAAETQFHPAADSAKFPGTDIFNALLGTITPAPSTDRAGGIGRKGAPAAQQKRSPGDPLASINPTDIAVNQMATRSPAKATVAAAEQDSTTPRNAVLQGSRKPVQGPTSAAHNGASSRPDAAPSGQAKSPAGPNAAMQAQTTNVAAASQASAAATGSHATDSAARGTPAANFVASPLARLISPTAPHSADRGQATPRAILRPVVAQQAQGRPSTKSATRSQSPARPQDPETEFAAQLNRGFGAILRQNGGSLTLRLQPQDLGDMTIRMDLTPGKVTAAFEVESDQARQLLNDNLSTLRSALEARGLGVDSLTVQVSERSPQDALTRAEPESSSGGANPDGGGRWAEGQNGESGTDRPHAFVESLDARSAPESFPEAGATGVVTGGAQLIRLALDAVA